MSPRSPENYFCRLKEVVRSLRSLGDYFCKLEAAVGAARLPGNYFFELEEVLGVQNCQSWTPLVPSCMVLVESSQGLRQNTAVVTQWFRNWT